jgi:hypothetical protein
MVNGGVNGGVWEFLKMLVWVTCVSSANQVLEKMKCSGSENKEKER